MEWALHLHLSSFDLDFRALIRLHLSRCGILFLGIDIGALDCERDRDDTVPHGHSSANAASALTMRYTSCNVGMNSCRKKMIPIQTSLFSRKTAACPDLNDLSKKQRFRLCARILQ